MPCSKRRHFYPLLLLLLTCGAALQAALVTQVEASGLADPKAASQRFTHWHTTTTTTTTTHAAHPQGGFSEPAVPDQLPTTQAPDLKPTSHQPSLTPNTNTHTPIPQQPAALITNPDLHTKPTIVQASRPADHTSQLSSPNTAQHHAVHEHATDTTSHSTKTAHSKHAYEPIHTPHHQPTDTVDSMHIIRLESHSEAQTGAPTEDTAGLHHPTKTLHQAHLHKAPHTQPPEIRPNNRVIPRGEPTRPAPKKRVPVLVISAMTLLMACCSGLGALPFFFVGKLTQRWAGLANAVACGVMLACSFDLIHEGQPFGPMLVLLGMLGGAMFIRFMQEFLDGFEDASFEDLQGADARKVMLIIGVMAAHALGEGSGVGVSFSGERGWTQGTLVTIAIGLHNIPEGLAVATVMASKGSSPWSILLWSTAIALPQPLLAIPSYIFVDMFQFLLPLALGFAAGCMVWMVFAELMPDALEHVAPSQAASAASFSAASLEGLRMLISEDGSSGAREVFLVQAGMKVMFGVLVGALPGAISAAATGAAVGGLFSPPGRVGLSAGACLVQALVWVNAARREENVTRWELVFWISAGAVGSLLALRHLGMLQPKRMKSKLDPELGFNSLPTFRSGSHPRGPTSVSSTSSWEMLESKHANAGDIPDNQHHAHGNWDSAVNGVHMRHQDVRPLAARQPASPSFGLLLSSAHGAPATPASCWIAWLLVVAMQCCALGALLATQAFTRVDALHRLAFPGVAQGIMVGLSAAGPACHIFSSRPRHTALLASLLFLLAPLTSCLALSPFPLGRSWPAGPVPLPKTHILPGLPILLSAFAIKLQSAVAGVLLVFALVMLTSVQRRVHQARMTWGAVVGGVGTFVSACLMYWV